MCWDSTCSVSASTKVVGDCPITHSASSWDEAMLCLHESPGVIEIELDNESVKKLAKVSAALLAEVEELERLADGNPLDPGVEPAAIA